ncbi:hypothetical protein IMSHALPRED_006784 [Imshaugia aleurites]|uniref:DUF7791 domain-containing protein n=1 Tax=Imshaugia aleurites TaxID=172621 RepID=A0A8H3FQ04_9LECA|nr:hypothetical protein IMSHALPRED_006784 [Imshaugia aleurites]
MPTEVEDVYVHLLNKISKFYKTETAQTLEIILQIRSSDNTRIQDWPYSVLDVALLRHKELDHIISSSAHVCMTDIVVQCDRTKRRLFVTYSAFLEIENHHLDSSLLTHLDLSEHQMELFRSGNATVDFLHRSVADFFQKGQGRDWLKKKLVTEHQTPVSDFLKTQIAKARLLGFPVSTEYERLRDCPWFPKAPQTILYSLRHAEAELGHPPSALCSAIDRAMTILYQQRQGSDQRAHWILHADKQSLEQEHLDFGPASTKEPVNTVSLTRSSDTSVNTLPSPPAIRLARPKDFLGLLASLGLDLYVEESIKASSSPLSVSYVNYMLSCVLLSLSDGLVSGIVTKKRLRLVDVLMTQGANPNEAAV